jgi:hypothetical protein
MGGEKLFGTVQGIEGKSAAGRHEYIKEELKRMNVGFRTMAFDTTLKRGTRETRVTGENIIVRLGKGPKHLVVGAHCDAVPGSPGANDNGGGVAVMLGLITTLKDYGWKCSVDFCFFDQEEVGLIGSAVYVREYRERQRHAAMINLDVEGTGDEVYVGPVGGGDDNLIMKYVRAARDKTRLPYFENESYPGSDHESFARARLENISISIVPRGDGKKLSAWARSGFKPFANPGDIPVVLGVMHSSHDSSTYVTPKALSSSYEFTKAIVQLFNESQ